MSVVGAELTRSTAAVAVGLAAAGFGTGLLPRAGPRAAAMALPLLMGFAYSAAQPLAEASAGSRAAAVLVALPAYLIAAAVVFQTDQRRPIIAGSAAALGGLSSALGLVAAGQPGAAREAEGTILRFRLATARLKDAALPMGRALDSRAGLLLMTSVQQAAAATEFLASDPQQPDGRRRERIAAVSTAAGDLAAALAHRYPAPPTDPLDDIGDGARRDGDRILTFLAEALAGAGRATAVLLGRSHTLPPGLLGEFPGAAARLRASLHVDDPAFRRAVRLGTACGLAGVVAGLLGLGRSYWAVFAAVVVLNAPVAVNRRRALMRIVGTVAGFSPAQSAGGSTSPISTPTKRPRGPVPS